MQVCRSGIAQVEYQGQTPSTRIIDSKPFIDTCYCIGHRLELKYFHVNSYRAAHWQQKSENCCFAKDSIRNMRICCYALCLLRDKGIIERLSEAMGSALLSNNLSPIA